MITPFAAAGLIVRRHLTKGGRGVFATRPFGRGDLLVVWGGRAVSGAELEGLSTEQKVYALQVDEDVHLVTPLDEVDVEDLVNHSCMPNAGLSDAVTLVALRPIRRGEEVCFDYAMSDANVHSQFACQCGRPLCRGFVRHDDWRLPDLQRRYRHAFSPYLRRRISAEGSANGLPQALHERRAHLHQDRRALLHQAVEPVAVQDQHLDFVDGGDGG
jgi:hypothetical protein